MLSRLEAYASPHEVDGPSLGCLRSYTVFFCSLVIMVLGSASPTLKRAEAFDTA